MLATEEEVSEFDVSEGKLEDYVIPPVDLVRALTVRKQLYKIRHKIIAGVLVDAESQVEIELELMPQVIKILCDLGYTIGKTYKPGNKSTYILSWRPEEEESDDSSGSTASFGEEEPGIEHDGEYHYHELGSKRTSLDTSARQRPLLCRRCHKSLDMDPQALDGKLPDYMQGLCSACFEEHYTQAAIKA